MDAALDTEDSGSWTTRTADLDQVSVKRALAVPWSHLCAAFEKQIMPGKKNQDVRTGLLYNKKLLAMLTPDLDDIGPERHQSMYPLLRLTLPEVDMDRRYNAKEKVLAGLYQVSEARVAAAPRLFRRPTPSLSPSQTPGRASPQDGRRRQPSAQTPDQRQLWRARQSGERNEQLQ